MLKGRKAAWLTSWDPDGEQVAEFRDGGELLVMDGGWSVLDCAREEVQGVDDAVPLYHCGLGEVVVKELNGV